mgnify:CR=1 FL=1
MKVGEVLLDELARDRDQLWAEAAHRQAAGEAIRMDPALWPAALEPMITVSDNDAADTCVALLHRVGMMDTLNARFADGNNNESSSEAMNAWTGLILWGAATGDDYARAVGAGWTRVECGSTRNAFWRLP